MHTAVRLWDLYQKADIFAISKLHGLA